MFLCLTGTYNHRQEWIESLCQSFIDQTYQGDALLVIVDDRKEGLPEEDQVYKTKDQWQRTIATFRMDNRAESLLHKYQYGIDLLQQAFEPHALPYDYVCAMDDDDTYTKWHLQQHAEVLRDHMWSYPSHVFSTYAGNFIVEPSGGRFWASSAYRMEALRGIGNYTNCDCLRPDFDQQFLHRLRTQYGLPGSAPVPSYVYNWSVTADNHSSGHIDGGVWQYGEIPESPATGPLEPKWNVTTERILEMAQLWAARN